MKNIEQEIVDILRKMSTNKIVMPSGWSGNRQLGTTDISYRTYDGGSDYKNLDFTIDDKSYSIQLRYGKKIVIEEPLANRLSPVKLLEIINTIYKEAISPESIIEGEVNLRKKIANVKKEISMKKIELHKLEGDLNGF